MAEASEGTLKAARTKFSALSSVEIEEYLYSGLSEDGINKANDAAKARIDKQLQGFTLQSPRTENQFDGKEIRLVFLGETGSGKSTTGNTLLGYNAFTPSSLSVSCTRCIAEGKSEADGTTVRIIDTPGFQDTSLSKEDIFTEIAKVAQVFNDGVHGFIFVHSIGNPRFTEEEAKSFDAAEKTFGADFLDHCFVLFTHCGELGSSLSEHLKKESEAGSRLCHLLDARLHMKVIAVENKMETEYGKQAQRMQTVRTLKSWIRGAYDCEAFKQARRETAEAMRLSGVRTLSPVVQQIDDLLIQHLLPFTRNKLLEISPDSELWKKICTATFEQIGTCLDEAEVKRTITCQFHSMITHLAKPNAVLQRLAIPLMTLAVAGIMAAVRKDPACMINPATEVAKAVMNELHDHHM